MRRSSYQPHTDASSAGSQNRLKAVLIDASSAILLYKCGLFDSLARAFHTRMTPSVYDEITRDGYPGAAAFRKLWTAGRFNVIDSPAMPLPDDRLPGIRSLDRGERDTIDGYIEGYADFVIIDDGKGAGCCRTNDIPYINALLVPKILLICGKLNESECVEKMGHIISIGRYSIPVKAYAMYCSRTELEFFLPCSRR